MTAGLGRLAGGLAAIALLAACAAVQHPTPGGPSFESDDFDFVAPTGWEVQPSSAKSLVDGGIVLYLANQTLRDDCPASRTAITCHLPN